MSPPVKSHPRPIRLGFVKQHLDVTFSSVPDGLCHIPYPNFLPTSDDGQTARAIRRFPPLFLEFPPLSLFS